MEGVVESLLDLANKRFDYHIKATLRHEDKHKLEEFKTLTRDFNDKLIEFPTFRQQISQLFGDYPDLEEEFTTFYPEYDAEFLNFVEETLEGEDDLLPAFEKLLKEYRAGKVDVKEFTDEVSLIFEEHLELVDGLYYFVPIEALVYLDLVKDHFAKREDGEGGGEGGFEEFSRLLRELLSDGSKFDEVGAQFLELFQNDSDLIQGLNRFLPEDARLQRSENGAAEFPESGSRADAGHEEERGRSVERHEASNGHRARANEEATEANVDRRYENDVDQMEREMRRKSLN